MKWTKISFVFALAFVLLCGCTANRGGPNEGAAGQKENQTNTSAPSGSIDLGEGTVEIEIMHSWGGDKQPIEKVIEEYEKTQHKVKVKSVRAGANYEELIEKLQVRAVAKQLPDLFAGGFLYDKYVTDNFPVIPVQTFVDKENYDLSDVHPEMINLGRNQDGKIYGMPIAVSVPMVYINGDLFKAAGFDPGKLPKTWDELRTVAKKLTTGDQFGIYFDYITISGNWTYEAMLNTAGGSMLKDANHVGFNSPAGKKAVQLLRDLVGVDQSMPNMTRPQADQLFYSGKLAMLVTSSGNLTPYTNNASFQLLTDVFPAADGGAIKVPAGGSNVFMLAQDPWKQAAAWDFMKFLISAKGTSIIAKETGYLAVSKSALEKPELMKDYLSKDPNAMTAYKEIVHMVPWSNFPGENTLKINKALKDNITAAVLGQKTVDQALSDAEAQANDLIK